MGRQMRKRIDGSSILPTDHFNLRHIFASMEIIDYEMDSRKKECTRESLCLQGVRKAIYAGFLFPTSYHLLILAVHVPIPDLEGGFISFFARAWRWRNLRGCRYGVGNQESILWAFFLSGIRN